jgi:hypothetical protein
VAAPLWEPDGTQPPPPPQAWDDPVFGLVTGAAFESEPFTVEVVEPVMPDMSEVRRAVDAALSGEDQPLTPVVPPQRRRSPQPPRVPPGIMPPNPRAGWPRNPSGRALPGLRPRLPSAGKPVTRVRRPAGQRRPRGSSAGMAGLVIFILVIVVIVVTAIGSLLNTISTLFN